MYVNILRQPHAPEQTFVKPGASTDAGYDLCLADDAIVLPLSQIPRTLHRIADVGVFTPETLASIGYKDGELPKDSPYTVKDGGLWQMRYDPPLYRTGLHTVPVDKDGVWFMVVLRSSSSMKTGLRLHNAIGVIDAEYKGEILLTLYSAYEVPILLPRGERVAQLIPMPLPRLVPVMTQDTSVLNEASSRRGGFGSTNMYDPTYWGMSGNNIIASFES